MNIKILLLFLAYNAFIPLLSNITAAQDGTKNSLAFKVGLGNLHILDEHATPVIFRGTGVAPSAEYVHDGRSGWHSLEGSFCFMNLSAASDNYKTEILAGHLRYGYFRPLFNGSSADNRPVFAAGASVSSHFMKYDYLILPATSWIKGIESWYGSHSLELAAQARYGWGKGNKVRMLFYLPLLSNVSRPAYSSSGDYNYEKNDWDVKAFGKTMIIPKNLMFNAIFSYQRILKKNLGITAGYEFCFAQCRKPDLVRWYMNSFRAGIIYNFNNKQDGEE